MTADDNICYHFLGSGYRTSITLNISGLELGDGWNLGVISLHCNMPVGYQPASATPVPSGQ